MLPSFRFEHTAKKNELHIGLGIPKPISVEIHTWAEEQDWPEGTELEPIEDYHITMLYSPEGHEHKDDPWMDHESHAVSIKGIKAFPSKERGDKDAIVLTVDSETIQDHHKELARKAEEAGVEISAYSHEDFKPHMTIAYGKLPSGLKPPKLTFETEVSSVSPPRDENLTDLLQESWAGYGCGQIWVNEKKKKVLINVGDGEGDKVEAIRDLAKKQWPDHDVETEAEIGFPGDGWELDSLSAAKPTKQEDKKSAWHVVRPHAPYEAALLRFADSWTPKDQWPNALRERNGEPVDVDCTCKDGHKLDCPVHGMHPTLPTYDDTLEFPDPNSPIGYNYHTEAPRTWMRAETSKKAKHDKLWVDDTRRPPSDDWDWARNVAEAIELTKGPPGEPKAGYKHMSLDHDLGIVQYEGKVVVNPDALDGGDFVLWLHEHGDKKHMPKSVNIHSHNKNAIELMVKALEPHTKVTVERAPDHLEEEWAREFKVHEPSAIEEETIRLPERIAGLWKCPTCHHDVPYRKKNLNSCPWCGYPIAPDLPWAGDPQEQLVAEHPDPWMDSEPGLLTFPSQWNFAKVAGHQLAWLPGSNLRGKGLVTPSGDVHTWPVDENGSPHHAEYVDQRQPYQLNEGTAYFFQIRPRGGLDTKSYATPANVIHHVLQVVPSLHAGEHTDWHFGGNMRVMYHSSPSENRADIKTWGLFPSDPRANPMWGDDSLIQNQPNGVYLSQEPTYWKQMANPKGVDIWRIRVDPEKLIPDPVHHGSYLHQGPISPSQIELHTPTGYGMSESERNLWRAWPGREQPTIRELDYKRAADQWGIRDRHFSKIAMPIDPDEWEQMQKGMIPEVRDYVYHRTPSQNLESIEREGLQPNQESRYQEHLRSRPGHIYFTTYPSVETPITRGNEIGPEGGFGDDAFLRVRREHLSPQNINPDEDTYWDTEDLRNVQHKYNSLGEAAEGEGWGNDPRDTAQSIRDYMSLAYRGEIPPEQLERAYLVGDDPNNWQHYAWRPLLSPDWRLQSNKLSNNWRFGHEGNTRRSIEDLLREYEEKTPCHGYWDCETGAKYLAQSLAEAGHPATLQIGRYWHPTDRPETGTRDELHYWVETPDQLIDPNGQTRGEPRIQPLVNTTTKEGDIWRQGQNGRYEPFWYEEDENNFFDPKYKEFYSSKQAADQWDTREYPDSRMMPPTTMQEPIQNNPHPEKQGCTCEEGAKLDCPVHGMNPTEQDYDHSWSIPQGHPVGYPDSQPRSYMKAEGKYWNFQDNEDPVHIHEVFPEDGEEPWTGLPRAEGAVEDEDEHQENLEGEDVAIPVAPPKLREKRKEREDLELAQS